MNKLLKTLFFSVTTIVFSLSFYYYGHHNGVFEGYELAKKSVAYEANKATIPPSFTGMDVFNEVNKYRREKGLPEWKMSFDLCNNILERFNELITNKNHDGFDAFSEKQISAGRWPRNGKTVAELIAEGISAEDVVNKWSASPGHYLGITDMQKTEACTYAFNGFALLLTR